MHKWNDFRVRDILLNMLENLHFSVVLQLNSVKVVSKIDSLSNNYFLSIYEVSKYLHNTGKIRSLTKLDRYSNIFKCDT